MGPASGLALLLLSLRIKAEVLQLTNQLVDLDDLFKLLWEQLVALFLLVLELSCLPELFRELLGFLLPLSLGVHRLLRLRLHIRSFLVFSRLVRGLFLAVTSRSCCLLPGLPSLGVLVCSGAWFVGIFPFTQALGAWYWTLAAVSEALSRAVLVELDIFGWAVAWADLDFFAYGAVRAD